MQELTDRLWTSCPRDTSISQDSSQPQSKQIQIHQRRERPVGFCIPTQISDGAGVCGQQDGVFSSRLLQRGLVCFQAVLELLLERGSGEGVEDGIQAAVDGQNKDDDPGCHGTCSGRREQLRAGFESTAGLQPCPQPPQFGLLILFKF